MVISYWSDAVGMFSNLYPALGIRAMAHTVCLFRHLDAPLIGIMGNMV